MEVEVYDDIEVSAEMHPEVTEEALRLIKELGLEGQEPTKTEEGQEVRNPFPKMTKEQIITYKMYCPSRYNPSRYSRTAIPLRVLQAMAFAKGLECFKELEIWDLEDATLKDPVLVGKDDNRNLYLIARWGEVLEPFELMKKKALEIYQENCSLRLEKAKANIKARLDAIKFTSFDDIELDWSNDIRYPYLSE